MDIEIDWLSLLF